MSNAARITVPPNALAGPSLTSPFHGWIPRALWRRLKDFFIYGVDFLPLALSATATRDIAIQADSDFLIVAGVRLYSTNVDGPITTPSIATVQIVDSGSGRSLFNQPQHVDNVFGTAQLPAYWPMPKLVRMSSTLSTTLSNLEAVARNYRLAYWGFKVFPVEERAA
jgi:hypothetical protein